MAKIWNVEENVWEEYAALCPKCHAIVVFKWVKPKQKLYCPHEHFVGEAMTKEERDELLFEETG